MSLLARYLCNEGSGDVVAGSPGIIPVPGDHVNWGTGSVFGTNRAFITVGHTNFPHYDGNLEITPGGIAKQFDNFTHGFVGRPIISNKDGACIDFGGFHVRTWSKRLDATTASFQTRVLLTETQMKFGEWAIYVLVGRDRRYLDLYLNDMVTPFITVDYNVGNLYSYCVVEKLLSFQDSGYPGGMEFADIVVYDHNLSQAEREAYAALFTDTFPASYSFYKSDGEDFGGLYRWEEDDGGTGSTLTITDLDGTNAITHTGDGGTCQMAVATEMPRGLTNIWAEVEVYIPSNFDANHAIGSEFKVLSFYNGNPISETNEVFAYRLIHELVTQNISLDEVMYRNTVGANVSALPATAVTKGAWHTYKCHIDFTAGTIDAWYDGTLVKELTGLTLDLEPQVSYWGLALGLHPQNTGNYFYTRGHYVGETERVIAGEGMQQNEVMAAMICLKKKPYRRL